MKRYLYITSAALLVLVALQTSPSVAQVPDRSIYVGGFTGGTVFQHSRLGLENEVSAGGRVGYTFLPHWAVEGFVSASPTHTPAGSRLMNGQGGTSLVTREQDTDQLLYGGSIILNADFWSDQRWNQYVVPFVHAGLAGMTLYVNPDFGRTTRPVFLWGSGVNAFLYKSTPVQVAVRTEYRGQVSSFEKFVSDDRTFNNSEITGGITVYFPLSR